MKRIRQFFAGLLLVSAAGLACADIHPQIPGVVYKEPGAVTRSKLSTAFQYIHESEINIETNKVRLDDLLARMEAAETALRYRWHEYLITGMG